MALPRTTRHLLGITAAAGLGTTALFGAAPLNRLVEQPAMAQGTPGIVEFRWEDSKDYRKLYFFISDTQRLKRADYYLILRPKDLNTALLKLTVTIPSSFKATIDTKRVELCKVSKGGITSRTRCQETIPATIELSENGRALEIFPDTPIADTERIAVHMRLFNPYSIGMYQFNALGQAPGDVPVSGYLGSWLIQIEPPNS
jgi:hypothetical protein